MEAVRIFRHSVLQVFDNFGAALRISVLPTLLQWILLLVFAPRALAALFGAEAGLPSVGPMLITFIAVALPVTASFLVIAVNWHRFILLNEKPRLLPRLHGKEIIAYLLRVLLALLVLVAALIPMALALGLVGRTGSFALTLVLTFVMNIVAAALVLRLSISLPAMAIDRRISLSAGWRALRGRNDVAIVLALITTLLQFMLPKLVAIFWAFPLAAVVLNIAIGWTVMTVGLSILTTLYGHYVEGRPLR